MSEPHVEPRGGGRVFLGLLVAATLATGAWLALGLPRATTGAGLAPDPGWRSVHDEGAVLPEAIRRELTDRLGRFRRDRGVELEVHVAPEKAPPGWSEGVVVARLEALEDGRPRALVLVLRGPDRVEVRANQGLEELLDAAWKDNLAAHVAPALRARRFDLAARRGVYRVVASIGDFLGEDETGDWGGRRPRAWPRRLGGRTRAQWHARTGRAVGGLVLLGMLGLLASAAGRRALRGWEAPPRRGPRGWFLGAGDAGGFGGGVRAGRKPRPGW